MNHQKMRWLFVVLFVATTLQGCIKDKCTTTYQYFQPVYKTTAEVRANIKSNAAKPVERAGKLYIRGRYIFLNEVDKGIHIIDNINPSNPQNVAFIDIPGNMDMAAKGNYLYADAYTDMITIDISDPLNAKVSNIKDNCFPYRYYGAFSADRTQVIVDWQKRDTTVNIDCGNGGFFGVNFNKEQMFMYNDVASALNSQNIASSSYSAAYAASASVSPFGVGGSMARFAIVNNNLYTVSSSNLSTYSIQTPQMPNVVNDQQVGFGIETIFPFKNNLFIGSTTGMFIYSIGADGKPSPEGSFSHVMSCDPVIADDDYAYVTLRSGTPCNGSINQLEVLDITDIKNPSLLKTYSMKNPHGLSKDGNLLLICDGEDGVKVYDATNVNDIKLINQVTGINAFDVIAMNGIAIVVTPEGLRQYLYTDPKNISLLSKIEVVKQ